MAPLPGDHEESVGVDVPGDGPVLWVVEIQNRSDAEYPAFGAGVPGAEGQPAAAQLHKAGPASELPGADFIVLCDTNGGTMPFEIQNITEEVRSLFPKAKVGIHCHEDTGMAVASSIMAVQGGASMVQGTFLGFGERCGNANLCTIIANLQLKMGYTCIPEEKMEDLTVTARYMADVANLSLPEKEPYVGRSSFSHKGGMHIDGVNKNPKSFEHIQPETGGNSRRLLMSERVEVCCFENCRNWHRN